MFLVLILDPIPFEELPVIRTLSAIKLQELDAEMSSHFNGDFAHLLGGFHPNSDPNIAADESAGCRSSLARDGGESFASGNPFWSGARTLQAEVIRLVRELLQTLAQLERGYEEPFAAGLRGVPTDDSYLAFPQYEDGFGPATRAGEQQKSFESRQSLDADAVRSGFRMCYDRKRRMRCQRSRPKR